MADNITAWWGAITGTAALGLSAFNTWHSNFIRLRVTPRITRDPSGAGVPFTILLVNHSGFEVRVESAGLVLKDAQGAAETLPLAGFAQGMPLTLPARASHELHLTIRHTVSFAVSEFDHVFAVTTTGQRFRSSRWHPFKGKKLGDLQGAAR